MNIIVPSDSKQILDFLHGLCLINLEVPGSRNGKGKGEKKKKADKDRDPWIPRHPLPP